MKKIVKFILLIIIFITYNSGVLFAQCNCNCASNYDKIIVEDTVYKSRNIDIPATVTIPKNKESFPLVVIVHGFGTGRMYDKGLVELSELLSKNGIASIRMDFSGCGSSKESFRNYTLKNNKLDIINAIKYMKTRYNISQIGIVGYSFGGRIVLEMLAEGQTFSSVVLIAPCADNNSLSRSDEGYSFEDLKNYAKTNGYVPFKTNRGNILEISNNFFEEVMFYNKPEVLLQQAKQFTQNTPIMVIWAKDDKLITPDMTFVTYTILGAKSFEATGDGHRFGFLAESTDNKNVKLRKRVVRKVFKFLKHTIFNI